MGFHHGCPNWMCDAAHNEHNQGGVAALWLSVLSHPESGMRVKREREGCAASALRRPAESVSYQLPPRRKAVRMDHDLVFVVQATALHNA